MNPGGPYETGVSLIPPLDDFTFDDMSNARLFAQRYRGHYRWQADKGKWLVWTGKQWRSDHDGELMRTAGDFSKSLYQLVPQLASSKEQLMAAHRHASRSNNRAGILAYIDLAKSEMTVNSKDLDRDPYLLNTESGTIDLRDGSIRKHESGDFITKICPFEYNEDADCSRWMDFLETILPDPTIRDFVQRAVGYSLTGVVKDRAFFLLYGFGRNGKSVFIDTLSKVLGNYAINTSADTLMKKGSLSTNIPSDIARLKSARFVTTAETDEGRQLHESLIKAMTGGDKLTARYLFHEWFDFYFQGKIWLATNHKPVIKDQSNGMWDRVKLIPFSVTIPPEKAIGKDELVETLLSEAAGILAWAVAGCRQWYEAKRLITPEAIEREVAKYKHEQDSIAQFLEDRTETGEYFQIENSQLFGAYREYCRENNEHEFSHRRFSQKLIERGFTQMRTRKRYWNGIRLSG